MTNATNPIYRQVLKIQNPSDTKWDAEQANRLMVGLYSAGCPLNLVIRATAHRITWFVEVGEPGKATVMSAIQAVYPQASIEVSPKARPDLGYYRYQFEMGGPSLAPLENVSDLKKSDPLAGVVSAMKNLVVEEELVYELILSLPEQDYRKLGDQFLTASDFRWGDLLTERGRVESIAKQAVGADKVQRFTDEVTKAIVAKLSSLYMEARFFVKIKAQSKGRADILFNQFAPSTVAFDNGSLNYLVLASQESYPLLLSATEAAALWHLPSQDIQSVGVEWLTGVVTPLPSQLTAIAQTQGSIILGINSYQGKIAEVRLTYPDRVTHVNLIGRTRVGKSTLLHHMISQDIQAGKGVGVIDPHGDLVNDILTSSIPEHRVQDVVLFDVTDKEYPVGLNLLSAQPHVAPDTTASYALAVIRKMFAEQWSASRMEDVLYACLTSLSTYPGATLQDIPKLLSNREFRLRVLAQVRDPVALDFWHDEYEPLSPAHQLEISRPINSRMRRFYRDQTIRRILSQKHSLDFATILNTSQIFLANLGGIADVEGETLGALLISKIQMAAMSRSGMAAAERPPFYLYIDEVQNFITTSLSKMFSEAAKYGLSLVVANQFLNQLEGDTLQAIVGNVGATIIFRVGPEDARLLAGFVQPEVRKDDLLNLDRFRTVVKMQLNGQTLPAFSMETLPPLKPAEKATDLVERIRQNSRSRYARHRDEVDRELDERYSNESPITDNEGGDSKGGFLG